jgi:hypothetical protein
MNSKGHTKIMLKSIDIFNKMYPENKIVNDSDINMLIKGVVDPDHLYKTKGSHYAIYDKETDTFNNRIKGKKENAYTNLIKYFDLAIKNNDFYNLGFALHFVTDMLTIPHATGIQIAPLYRFGRHRKYERYTSNNMEKYFIDDVKIDDLFKKDIKTIFKMNVDLINSYKDKLNKNYYDEINNKMIPLILKYNVYFMYLFFLERR